MQLLVPYVKMIAEFYPGELFMSIVKKVFNAITGEKAFFVYIVAVMTGMPLASFIFQFVAKFSGTYINAQPYVLMYLGIAGGVIFMLSLLKRLTEEGIYPSDLMCILLIVCAFISLIFTRNAEESLSYGNNSELIYHFIAYFILMYAATMLKTEKLRKGVLYVLLGTALFHSFIALLQTFGVVINDKDPTVAFFCIVQKTCLGLTGNVNYYAGLGCVFTAAGIGAFFFLKNKLIRIFSLAVAILGFYTSICTGARIAWVGNIAIFLFYIVSFIIMSRKNPAVKSFLKILGIVILIAAIILGIIFAINSETITNGIEETIKQSEKGFNAFGTYRGGIWRYGLASVKDNWATGTGLNNYIQSYYDYPNPPKSMHISRKAHNEYIHTLVTQGVFAFLIHLLTHIYACVIGVKTVLNTKDDKNRYMTWIFLGMFITYWCQSMFNVSIIDVAVYFWISAGMVMPLKNQKPLSLIINERITERKAPYQIRPTAR